MNDPNRPSIRGWNLPGFGEGYPGLGHPGAFGNPGFGGDPFFGPPSFVNPTVLPPGGGPSKSFALSDIKNMIDRMGGIDGILSGIGKFQKFMSTMQQLAPLLRLFIGSSASTKSTSLGAASQGVKRRRRPRRSRRRSQRYRQRSRRR